MVGDLSRHKEEGRETVTAIQRLIEESETWLKDHKLNRRHIEAAACSIRIKALKDALAAMREMK